MSAHTRVIREGEVIFHEGTPSKSLYLVKKGTVAIRKRRGSQFIDLGKIYPNEVIGELSFFDRKARSASAFAFTDVELLEIDFISLDQIYDKVPDYLKTIMCAVAERLRKANDVIKKLQKETVSVSGKASSAESAHEPEPSEETPAEDHDHHDMVVATATATEPKLGAMEVLAEAQKDKKKE